MKRVLIISYYWPPSGGAGVQRWLKFAKYLPEFGWEPIILTVDPEYASYPVTDRTLEKEVVGTTRVIRTESRESFSVYKKVSGSENIPYAGFANEKSSVSSKQKIARFIRGNFFLPDPRKGWNTFALEKAREILTGGEIDCFITSSPPHSTQLIGLSLSKEFEIPWIADLRDPWTDIYYYRQFYPTRWAHRINRKMERSVIEKANAVITVSPALKELFSAKSASRTRIEVITNGYDPDDFIDLPSPSDTRFVITYVGTLADIYPVDTFIDAFREFLKKNPGSLLRFIGTISPGHLRKIKSLPEENIELIPYVDHRTAIEFMSKSSILLLIIPDSENNKGIITGKLFEYMAVGRPILFIGPEDGDGAEIIRQSNAVSAIESFNEGKIIEFLNSQRKYIPASCPDTRFSRKELTRDLSQLMNQLI